MGHYSSLVLKVFLTGIYLSGARGPLLEMGIAGKGGASHRRIGDFSCHALKLLRNLVATHILTSS